eukprot:5598393-Amphidinium_carterae.1
MTSVEDKVALGASTTFAAVNLSFEDEVDDIASTVRGESSQGVGAVVPAPKAKSKAQTKRKAGKGEIHCQGCRAFKKPECFSISHAVCAECKLYLDRIYGQCKRQGDLEWFCHQRRDPKKVRKILEHY